jgi:phosphate transport system permease protein
MSPSMNSVSAVEPRRLARPLHVFSTRFARRTFFDRTARHVVTLGGVVIIGAILAILVVIVGEVYPLLRPATARSLDPLNPGVVGGALAVETDEYRALAAVVTEAGLSFAPLAAGSVAANADLPALGAAKVTAVSATGGRSLALGLSDGRVIPIEI